MYQRFIWASPLLPQFRWNPGEDFCPFLSQSPIKSFWNLWPTNSTTEHPKDNITVLQSQFGDMAKTVSSAQPQLMRWLHGKVYKPDVCTPSVWLLPWTQLLLKSKSRKLQDEITESNTSVQPFVFINTVINRTWVETVPASTPSRILF